jgi:nucleotide-binding universal stress UspA family protein
MFGREPRPADPAVQAYSPLCRMPAGADVLALLPDPATAPLCLDIAEDAARAVQGCMGSEPLSLILSAAEIDLIQLRDRAEGLSRRRFDQVNQAFLDWRRGSIARRTVFLDDCRGDIERSVATECIESQLVVTARHGNIDARDAFRSVVFHAHKLVLVPPPRGYGGHLLGHVVIGWRPQDNARDTIIAAKRWLAVADRVTVLCIDDTADRHYQASAVALLAQLGINAQIAAVRSGKRSVGETIVDFVRTENATCLLIGAFKHSYVLELLLGRITQHVLSHTSVPVLMKH